MTPKSVTTPSLLPAATKAARSFFKCFGVGDVQGEVIDAPALEHRPLRRRRDVGKLEHVQRGARSARHQCMSPRPFGLGNRELEHLPGPEQLLVDPRQPIKVAREKSDEIDPGYA